MKISVLGSGRWGSFIAWYLSGQHHQVKLWGRPTSERFIRLQKERKNDYVTLDDKLILTSDLQEAMLDAQVIVVSISSQELRGFINQLIPYGIKDKKLILCMKGIEVDTGKRLTEVAIECGISKDNVAVWVGPGHIQSFAQGHPNCMLIDSNNRDLVKYLADNLRSDLIRFYYGDDIIGTEIGAAAKNVMGIAAGMLDGGGLTTLKGPLMARGAREVARLIKAMGGNELSAYGLCHLGDYETTLFSPYSNNRKFGEDYIRKIKFTKLAEGVSTSKAMKFLGEKYKVDLPITNAIYSILYEHASPEKTLHALFSRSTRPEF